MKKVRLALSGSGFLAPIHVGAICALMDKGVDIVEIAGTSGGSIAAALVGAGKTAQQLHDIALAALPDGILKFNIQAPFAQGYSTGDVMHQWLLDTIGPVTFAQSKVPIHIIATDINEGKPHEFNAVSTPDVAIHDACRASASIPFIYAPAKVNSIKLVDGGLVENLPVKYLIEDEIPRFGIRVMSGKSSGNTGSILSYAGQCLNTLLDADENNLAAWATETKAIIIPVDASPYSFLDCSMTLPQKIDLYTRGYSAVTEVLLAMQIQDAPLNFN